MAVAVPVEGPYEIHDWTVANTVAVPQYTLMMLSGSALRSAIASTGASPVWAGVAMSEKVDSDGSTELGLAETGTFDLTNSTAVAITAGSIVSLSGSNAIKQATEAEVVTGDVIGKALEEIPASAAGEVKVGAI